MVVRGSAAAPVKMKVAVVTGGGSGIGRACALALADKGQAVALVGRRIEELRETARMAEGLGRGMWPCALDVTDGLAVKAFFAEVVARWGRIDVLFNNAGIWSGGTRIDLLSTDVWQEVLSVNLTGAFLCSREAFAAMSTQSPQGGRIINNGSVASIVPRFHGSAYAAAKHGLLGLSRSLALDGRECGIVCTHLNLGNVSTEIGAKAAAGGGIATRGVVAEPRLELRYVADCVAWLADLPLSVEVPTLTMIPRGMPLLGRG